MKASDLKIKQIDYSKPGYKTMFANYGLTAIAALSLEKVIWLLIAAIDNLGKNSTDLQKIQNCLVKHKQKPMGVLIKELHKRIDVGSQLMSDLEEALKKRNFVIHHFFIERVGNLKDEPIVLSNELLPIRNFFLSIHSKVDALLGEVNKPYKEISPEIKKSIKSFVS